MLLCRKERGVCDGSVERQASLSLLLVKCVCEVEVLVKMWLANSCL